jgi:nucleotide-binding universal stress UspA family protein
MPSATDVPAQTTSPHVASPAIAAALELGAVALVARASVPGRFGRSAPLSELVHGLPCPAVVVTVGTEEQATGAVAVAFDGGPESRRALRQADAIAVRARLTLRVLTVAEPAGRALGEAAADASLLVVGSRAFGPARRVQLGPTARHLVEHPPCPVMIVPRG